MARIASLVHKLRWRAHLLASPGGFAEHEPFFVERGEFPIRELLLADARRLPLRERIGLANPLGPRPRIEDYLLQRRIRRAPDGEPYFDLGRHRIFFRPDHGVEREDELLKGTLLILKEAFVYPIEFFCPEVRIEEGDVVLDVGGNLGTSALLFSRLVGPEGRVISFEPVFHRLLQRNLEENGVANVRIVPLGVADRPGPVAFAVTHKGIDSRIASPSFRTRRPTVQVDLITLDQMVEQEGLERVDFVKMDIEGAEELALRGGMRTIERFRPRLSLASYHADPEGRKQHPRLLHLLHELGYRVREVPGRHLYAWWEGPPVAREVPAATHPEH